MTEDEKKQYELARLGIARMFGDASEVDKWKKAVSQTRAAELQRAPVQSEQPCPTCNGYGTLLDEEAAAHGICPDCNGTGSANRSDGG